jgi:hypothetical protein
MKVLEEIEYQPLAVSDRCDQCGDCSQAFVRAVKLIDNKRHDLLFCGHHYREHEPKLVMDGWSIEDSRNTINEKPMSGSLINEE